MKAAAPPIEPRKTPVQARSTASVDAILTATVQVLLNEGRAKLTTTRVAQRAGVSVGTLYQYFPNKNALLHSLLKLHLEAVAVAIEQACDSVHGQSLQRMAQVVAADFVQAKFHNLDASVALYAVSDDVEGRRISRSMHQRSVKAMATALATAKGRFVAEPQRVAATLFAAMAGVSRGILESGANRSAMPAMQKDLAVLMSAYLTASATSGRSE